MRAWPALSAPTLLFALLLIGCGEVSGDTQPLTDDPNASDPPPALDGLPRLADSNPDPDIFEATIIASAGSYAIDGERSIDGYLFNGSSPGPTLEAKVGDEIIIHFFNNLPEPTTIHWHGMRIDNRMDGSPRVQDPVQPGELFEYRFVAPDAGTFWYHPHIRTNEQVERGLYGAIVIHDPSDPEVDGERVLMLDDIYLTASNTIAPFLADHAEAMHGRYGNELLTNGRSITDAPLGGVPEGSVERWRIINSANARTMEISISGARARIIGSDGGLFEAPIPAGRFAIAAGHRFDLEIAYDRPGMVELVSHVLALNQAGQTVELPLPVYVVASGATAESPRDIPWQGEVLPNRPVDRDVTVEFDAVNSAGGLQWRLNGLTHGATLFTFQQGETVRMHLTNLLGPEHPFHLHGQFFQVVNPPLPGLRDTVLLPGMSEVEVIAYFDNPGNWLAHCHILEHAALGMVSEIIVAQ